MSPAGPLMRRRLTNSSALAASTRCYTDRVLIGCCSAVLTSTTTIGLYHLIVTPVSLTIGLATVATAAASGALCVIDGGSSGGTSFGAVVGIVFGALGGSYAKSQKEPWRK